MNSFFLASGLLLFIAFSIYCYRCSKLPKFKVSDILVLDGETNEDWDTSNIYVLVDKVGKQNYLVYFCEKDGSVHHAAEGYTKAFNIVHLCYTKVGVSRRRNLGLIK